MSGGLCSFVDKRCERQPYSNVGFPGFPCHSKWFFLEHLSWTNKKLCCSVLLSLMGTLLLSHPFWFDVSPAPPHTPAANTRVTPGQLLCSACVASDFSEGWFDHGDVSLTTAFYQSETLGEILSFCASRLVLPVLCITPAVICICGQTSCFYNWSVPVLWPVIASSQPRIHYDYIRFSK